MVQVFHYILLFFLVQSLLVQLNPKECLVLSKELPCGKNQLLHVMQRGNILVTERKKCELSDVERYTVFYASYFVLQLATPLFLLNFFEKKPSLHL